MGRLDWNVFGRRKRAQCYPCCWRGGCGWVGRPLRRCPSLSAPAQCMSVRSVVFCFGISCVCVPVSSHIYLSIGGPTRMLYPVVRAFESDQTPCLSSSQQPAASSQQQQQPAAAGGRHNFVWRRDGSVSGSGVGSADIGSCRAQHKYNSRPRPEDQLGRSVGLKEQCQHRVASIIGCSAVPSVRFGLRPCLRQAAF